ANLQPFSRTKQTKFQTFFKDRFSLSSFTPAGLTTGGTFTVCCFSKRVQIYTHFPFPQVPNPTFLPFF
ncbi:hypothetical protein, partial [Longispora fulva]|uniref:hypothetical protein n=1 Tax=Longispora fulva TaxID=619741 RepID=UPI00362550FD